MIPPVIIPLQHQGGFPGLPVQDVQITDALLQLGLFRRSGGFGRVLQGDDPHADQVRAVPVGRRHAQKGHFLTSRRRTRQKVSPSSSQGPAHSPHRTRPHIRQQVSPGYSPPPHRAHSAAGVERWRSRCLLCTVCKKNSSKNKFLG